MAVFRRMFRRPNLNSNMDVSSSKSGRGLFIILGLATILVLAAGAYMYGQQNNNREESTNNKPTAEQSSGASTPKPNTSETPNPSSTNQNHGGHAQSNSPVQPNTTSVPNTGPEDYYPVAVSFIVLSVWYYFRAKKASAQAQLFKTS